VGDLGADETGGDQNLKRDASGAPREERARQAACLAPAAAVAAASQDASASLGRSPPAGAAQRLGRFLGDLHAIDPATVAGVVPNEDAEPGAWVAGLDGPPNLVRIVHATRPRPSSERVVAHADLGAEHILEVDGTLTGIIDWSDAAITDPALDLARLYRDFGPRFLEALSQVYGPLRHAMPRVKFFARCAALEDLAYGRATGRREYVANAQRSLAWLFP
jgi:aminoglycoside phosphotransferase (APT) family kinase protein